MSGYELQLLNRDGVETIWFCDCPEWRSWARVNGDMNPVALNKPCPDCGQTYEGWRGHGAA